MLKIDVSAQQKRFVTVEPFLAYGVHHHFPYSVHLSMTQSYCLDIVSSFLAQLSEWMDDVLALLRFDRRMSTWGKINFLNFYFKKQMVSDCQYNDFHIFLTNLLILNLTN